MVEWMGAWHRMLDLYLAPINQFVPVTKIKKSTWYKSLRLYQVHATTLQLQSLP